MTTIRLHTIIKAGALPELTVDEARSLHAEMCALFGPAPSPLAPLPPPWPLPLPPPWQGPWAAVDGVVSGLRLDNNGFAAVR